jgi:hypothetical protein
MTQSFQQLLVTNYGLQPSGYTGSQGVQGIAGTGGGPKISAVQVTDSSGTVLDDTAVDVAGGYILLTGSGFESGCQVVINTTPAVSTTFVSATQVRAQVAATPAGTYIVYLVNADGGVAIRINGITFSAVPAWVTGSALSGDSDTAISIQLSATGALTYSLAEGSTLPAGLTLSSTGLLSGTVTGIELETVYNFTVNAIDAELQDSPRSFAITISTGDAQIAYVTALLSPELEVLPFNQDASANNFAVSVVGDTRPNGFGPYTPGYYSNFFDGTGDYFTIPYNSELDLIPLTAWTFEAWIYSTSATGRRLFATDGGLTGWNSTTGIHVLIQTSVSGSSLTLNLQVATGTSTPTGVSAPTTFPINQWAHVAVSISGNTAYIAVNGVVTSGSISTKSRPSSNPTLAIGAIFTEGAQSTLNWIGYISNLRIVKNTALYTTNFTPPTAPLTAIAGTGLLTCQGIGFDDNSANKFTLTKIGNTQFTSFIPYSINSDYRSYGSSYFDGTGDYLAVPTNSAFAFGTGDFTYEAWFYISASGNIYQSIIETTDGTYNTSIRFGNGGFGNKLQFSTNVANTADIYSCSITQDTVVNNGWNHVAFTRQSGTCRAFLNGFLLSLGSGVNPGSYPVTSFTSTHNIGNSNLSIGSNSFTGYISNVRVLKGTALYTASFTPPAAPLTAVANTSLLTCQTNQPANNSAFLDSSTNNFLITRNGNTTQGAFSPYGGGWSNYFDGTGDYLSVANNAAFAPAALDFTIEAWVYINALAAGAQTIFGQADSAGTIASGIYFYACNSTGFPQVALPYGGSNNLLTSTTAISIQQWNHIAVARYGSTITIYVNGVASGTINFGTLALIASTQVNGIGRNGAGNFEYLNGYISNLRFVKGTAVYTANFTPSTSPLEPITGTSLLTCDSNRFRDASTNNFAITRNGDVSVQKFNPFGIQTAMTPQTHSAFFDGTGDYLTLSAAPVAATGTFTIECWVYVTGTAAAQSIYGQYLGGGSAAPGRWNMLWNDVANKFSFSIATSSYESASTYSTNTWYHIAWVRDGSNNLSLYVNGLRDSTTAGVSASLYTGNPIIGARNDGTTPYTGYISNFRVTNTVVYSGTTYTVPTSQLTAIAGTTVLTCQSSTLVDNSTNRLAITAAGNATPSQINPFGFTAGAKTNYTPAVYGGSMSFDGTGDFLSGSMRPIGLGLFTTEAWVYITNRTTERCVFTTRSGDTSDGFQVAVDVNGEVRVGFSGANFINSALNSVTVGQWHHIAVTRNSANVMTLWINGISSGTSTRAENFSSTVFRVGATAASASIMLGYISDFRVLNGQLLYTANFVPPTAPLEPITNTTLLLNGTAAAVRDASMGNNMETVGDAKLSTSVVKYGTTSMSFDGTGDYLLIPNSPNIDFGTGNFTIEFWLNLSNVLSTWQSIIGRAYTLTGGWRLYKTESVNELRWYVGTAPLVTTSSSSLTNNTWSHVAVVRNNGVTTIYMSGTSRGSAADTTNYTPGNYALEIGSGVVTSSFPMTGNISDLRITKGAARYTANFTPPAGAFKTK